MNTPIWDFVRSYSDQKGCRLHMPGHKGIGSMEQYDITEIPGADSLYEPSGIIRDSEQNASALFGSHTFYTTEGSSHAIRAMLHLTALYAAERGQKVKILAPRNAHKVFIGAAALLDLEVVWLASDAPSYLSSGVNTDTLADTLALEQPTALYLTSPDYLGHTEDIARIAEICHAMDVLLLVDNAHGAYLRFLSPSRHPIDLGADVCCDSAHKTLRALTGGAYLHIRHGAPDVFYNSAKMALALYGSTSPSYLILASLDRLNAYLSSDYPRDLEKANERINALKASLTVCGYSLYGDEPLKITLMPKSYGYLGCELAHILADAGIVTEFSDRDFTVLMLTPDTTQNELCRLESVLTSLPRLKPITEAPPMPFTPVRCMRPHQAMLCPAESLPIEECLGRTLAAVTVGCPPAVPILVMGEKIDERSIESFRYYGIENLFVVKP